MEISSSAATPNVNLGKSAAFSTLKNARDLPGKAALHIIESVAAQNSQAVNTSGSLGRNLNARA